MAKKKQPPPIEHHWLCEFCRKVHIGENPPDECEICANRFFDNLADVFEELQDANQLAQ